MALAATRLFRVHGRIPRLGLLKKFNAHSPFPKQDPRLHEAMGINVEPDEMTGAEAGAGGDE